MPVSRQTHLVAALILLVAFGLGHFLSHRWVYLGLLPTFGLTLDAVTGICPATLLLNSMPWNRAKTV